MARIPLFISALLALQASANVLGSRPLTARQIGGASIPAQCTSTCAILDTLDACQNDLSCFCTTANNQALAVCVDCIISVAPSTEASSQGQNVLDQYATQCFSGGITIPTASVSDFPTTSGALTGSSTSGTATLPTTTTGTPTTTTTTSSTPTSPTSSSSATVTTQNVPTATTTGTTTRAATTTALNPSSTGGAAWNGAGATAVLYSVMAVMGVGLVMI